MNIDLLQIVLACLLGKRARGWMIVGRSLRLETRDHVRDVVFVRIDAADGFVAEHGFGGGVLGAEICWKLVGWG
jgi:hypothetical protein